MAETFIKLKDLNFIILKDKNEYTLYKNVDFKTWCSYRISKYEKISIVVEKEQDVLKAFFNNGVIELENRLRNILNEKFDLFIGFDKQNRKAMIGTNKRHIELSKSLTGVINLEKFSYEIIEIFEDIKLFQEEGEKQKTRKEDFIYGLFHIEKNEFDYFFGHPNSVLVCFDDFGRNQLKKGSLFFKLKEIK